MGAFCFGGKGGKALTDSHAPQKGKMTMITTHARTFGATIARILTVKHGPGTVGKLPTTTVGEQCRKQFDSLATYEVHKSPDGGPCMFNPCREGERGGREVTVKPVSKDLYRMYHTAQRLAVRALSGTGGHMVQVHEAIEGESGPTVIQTVHTPAGIAVLTVRHGYRAASGELYCCTCRATVSVRQSANHT